MLPHGSTGRRENRGRGKKLTKGEPLREFLFRLALALGVWNVDDLAERIPMDLFWEWAAFYRLCPWGDDWRRTGRLATIVAAAAGAKVEGDLEERFMPGGGKYRGMNQTEIEMIEELKKIPQIRAQFDARR